MVTLPPTPSQRWKHVATLVGEALERPTHDRAAWLADACGGDDVLRREVESLLVADAGADAGGFLHIAAIARGGAAEAVASTAREALGLVSGRRVGPYEIVRELGHGGMGVVYLAARVDLAFDKQVAIKVVRSGFAADGGTRAVQRRAQNPRHARPPQHRPPARRRYNA